MALESKAGPSKRGKSKMKVHPGGHGAGHHEESLDSELFVTSVPFYESQILREPQELLLMGRSRW